MLFLFKVFLGRDECLNLPLVPSESPGTWSWNRSFGCNPSRKFFLNAKFIVALFPTRFKW